MGISLRSALIIQNNETKVLTYSNEEKTNYGFVVYMLKRGEIHNEIVSTIPHYPYKSSKEAEEIGDNLVKDVKEMDLNSEVSGLQKVLNPKTTKIVSKITRTKS